MKPKENLQGALRDLEKIVEDLGKKDIDVEAGLEKFREGVELIKYCRGLLKKSENEFKKLRSELDIDMEGTASNENTVNKDDLPF